MHDVFQSLVRVAHSDPLRPAVTDDRGTLGYADLAARIAAVATDQVAQAGPAAGAAGPGSAAACVGIIGPAGASWIVADLAATLAGTRVVPVPGFFSPGQVRHLLEHARVDRLLHTGSPADAARTAATFGIPAAAVDAHAAPPRDVRFPEYRGGGERVIFTSGTTGTPKGVLHGDRQLSHAVAAIARAVSADASDRHLSALPPSLLLEQVAGVFIPLSVGARIHVSERAVSAAVAGNVTPLLEMFCRTCPTTTILVPALLAALTTAAGSGAWTVPRSLRFAAVGGAPVAPALVRAARQHRIPVIRGYGLSECASVVALERPGAAGADGDGACGLPLDGIEVSIDDGEVVVRGPTVMNGHLDSPAVASQTWRTGDLGSLGADGTLSVSGRRDRVLVLANGRNVQADWVEGVMLAHPRIREAKVSLADDGILQMRCRQRLPVSPARRCPKPDRALQALLATLPEYARPQRIEFTADENHPAPPLSDRAPGTTANLETS